MIVQNLLSNKTTSSWMLFFISFKGRSALACFPFEGEDFSWNVRYDPQTREGDAEEDQEQPAAVGWSFFSRVMVRNSSISAFNLNSERDEVVRVVAATPVQSELSPVEVDPPPPRSPQPLKATIRPLPGVVLRWRWLRRVPQTQTDEWFKRIHKALSRIRNERGDVLGMHNCAENCICKRRWWFSGRNRAKWLRAILNRFVEMRLELY